jgi:hypothetical protein
VSVPTNDQIILKQLLEDRKRDVAPELSQASYFELFCAEQILKNYDSSYDDIGEGIVDSGGDGGIDSIYVLINGEPIHDDTDLSIYRGEVSIELHIIQSKTEAGFSEDAIHRLVASTSDLLNLGKPLPDLAKTYNAELLDIVGKFREAFTRFASKLPKLTIRYYYATLGAEIHPNVERQVARLQEAVKGLFSTADFSFDFLDARKLLELARSQPTATYNLKLADTPLAANNSFICLVHLNDYRAFITDEHGRYRRGIFDANVRDYQGDVEVNRAIHETLVGPEGEDFWWLNNGITILAKEASHTSKALTIRDPQVVNGLQTSQEVFRAFQSSTVPSDDRNLLVRVIIPQSAGSYERIVRATNSQTSVPPASLRATDPIHRNIEDFLKANGFYYERRKNYYKNEGRPRDKVVSISYVAQATMAVLLERPDDARGRPSTLIKSDQDYKTVFDPRYPVTTYLACVGLMKRSESFLRSKGLSAKEVNNIKFHLAMFAARRVLNVTKPSPLQLSKLAVDTIDDAFLDSCFSDVKSIYDELGGDDQVAKGPDFVKKLSERVETLTHKKRFGP